ncbi:hypothetical protein L3X38_018684 [Prunus dulcis]|uniref:Translation elongation factor EFTs/EF1B dimerisation domain-containing protein n=1 Tax=Prunus dulcis TaxID=3755 RepID=A0AAD4ZAB3_PRUDU|nr:hypothetical protein L3X38_018684 [Prunus dulcis]
MAAEGLLALAQNESKAAVIELNCETDFVAQNDIFQHLVSVTECGGPAEVQKGAVVPPLDGKRFGVARDCPSALPWRCTPTV